MQHAPIKLTRRLDLHPFLRRVAFAAVAAFAMLTMAAGAFFAASNEFFRFGTVIELREDILWGSAFAQMEFSYKLGRAQILKPEILVLGSSRSNQFRAEMMPGASFYNAAGAAQSAEHGLEFLSQLYRVHRPKLVVMTIDVWWFRSRQERARRTADEFEEFSYRKVIANAAEQAVNPKFLKSLIFEPMVRDADRIGGRRPVGYRAARYSEGYRPDGSHQYGIHLLDLDRYFHLQGYGVQDDFRYFTAQLSGHRGRFSYTGAVNPQTSGLLRKIVEMNKRNGVATIFVLPPMAGKVYAFARSVEGQRRYFSLVENEVQRLGGELNVEVHNLHDLAKLGVPDTQTIDGIHADEIGYLAVTSRILRDGASLSKFVDRGAFDRLESRMRDPANRPNFHLVAR